MAVQYPDLKQTAQAAQLRLKAEHYASAFAVAAQMCRNRGEEELAKVFDRKKELELSFAEALRRDPVGTLVREGL